MLRLPETFVLIVFSAALLCGCENEYSYEGGNRQPPIDTTDPGSGTVKSEWRFTETALKYAGPVDTAYLTQEGIAAVLTITGKILDGTQNIYIKLKDFSGKIQKGKMYQTSFSEVKFLYKQDNDTLYSAIPYYGGELYVTVIDYDSTRAIGTFTGLVSDKSQRSLSITDGYFSSPLKKALPSEVTGSIMLWAADLCNGPIRVNVNNKEGIIEKAISSAPDCGEPGGATYQLKPGVYDWVAYCGKDSVSGKATVIPNDCAKIEVKFPYKPAPVTNTETEQICKVSRLSFSGNLENANGKKFNEVSAEYEGRSIHILKYYVAPVPPIMPHEIKYSNDTIIMAPGTNYEKRFVTDIKGRVVEYYGSSDFAQIYPVGPFVLIRYDYNVAGQLIKREVLDGRYLYVKTETLYSWQNGNMVRVIENYPLQGTSKQTDYEYYDKEVKGMPFIELDALELVLFQPLFGFGKTMGNILKRKTITTMGNTTAYDYDSYVIDDNGYVLSCRKNFHTGKATSFYFDYTCF